MSSASERFSSPGAAAAIDKPGVSDSSSAITPSRRRQQDSKVAWELGIGT
jgi:hypothetical protein